MRTPPRLATAALLLALAGCCDDGRVSLDTRSLLTLITTTPVAAERTPDEKFTLKLAATTDAIVVTSAQLDAIGRRYDEEKTASFAEGRYPLSLETLALAEIKDKGGMPLIPASALATMRGALVNGFGSPGLPASVGADFLDPERLARGRGHYARNCVHCHGYFGQGDGPTAPFLYPRPRDFSRKGILKFTSTSGEDRYPNIKEDIARTIRDGIQSSAMPAFGYPWGPPSMHHSQHGSATPDQGVEDVAEYVALLLMRGRLEEQLASAWLREQDFGDVSEATKSLIADWKKAQAPAARFQPPAAKPPFTDALLKQGRDIFLSAKAQCSACHGTDGKGEGQSMKDEKNKRDDWGNEIQARDLTRGVYRGGRRPVGLYRRVHVGIKGTPMPGFGGVLKPDEVWAVVEYTRSLALDRESNAVAASTTPEHSK